MKRLWLFIFPMLFLPSFGLTRPTQFGVLEVADFLVLPFVVAVLVSPARKGPQRISNLYGLLFFFIAWACLSTLTIPFRYASEEFRMLTYCLLKIAKLGLYVTAGLMIARKLCNVRARSGWLWSLLAALVALSIGLFVTSAPYAGAISDAGLTGYKAYNSVSVSIAVLSSYLMGLWFDGVGNRKWRNAAGIALVLAPLSVLWTASSSAHGRGGWLALAAGCGYLIWNRLRAVSQSKAFKAVGVTVLIAGMIITAYRIAPNFRYLADETISSNSDDAASAASYAAVDDGGRISTWTHELPKLVDSPVLGTGFFHRGGTSGLWDSGSHNFFIQMFLETGLVGGICILAIFRRMWREAGCVAAREAKLTVATRSALVAAVVAGMSGEYFYGGIEVLVLLAVFAYAGSLPIVGRRQVAFGQRKPVRTFRGPGQSQPRTLQC